MTKPNNMPETLSLHVPFRIAKRGGRKEVQLPSGSPAQRSRVDNTLVKALARAFRWQRMLETGEHATVAELAQSERISAPFISRTLRLAFLPPDLIQAVLEGHQPRHLTLEALRQPLPAAWIDQKRMLGVGGASEDLG